HEGHGGYERYAWNEVGAWQAPDRDPTGLRLLANLQHGARNSQGWRNAPATQGHRSSRLRRDERPGGVRVHDADAGDDGVQSEGDPRQRWGVRSESPAWHGGHVGGNGQRDAPGSSSDLRKVSAHRSWRRHVTGKSGRLGAGGAGG